VQFTNNHTVNMYGYAHDVAISDLDLDGVQDIAVSMYSQNTATTGAGQIVYACKGSGVAGSPCLSFEGYAMEQPLMHGIVIGDYNNDAKPDIVTSSRTGQRIQYLMIGRMTNDSQ
jgi:hypothetical protein